MKKLLAAAILSLSLFSCTDTKKQEKDLLEQVIKTHDKVMSKDGMIMANKMKLDTFLNTVKDTVLKNQAIALQKQLTAADEKMENWMHNFDAENKNKSHAQIMNYLSGQKKEIDNIDKQLSAAVDSSGKFITQYKNK